MALINSTYKTRSKSGFCKFSNFSRDDWIRTSDLFVPNEARYRAALRPEARFITLAKLGR
jgi:hypothetical protein